jgi:coatomer protein complex subunit gamma
VKHFFKTHVVLQYEITNNVDDQVLSNLDIKLTPSDESGLVLVKTSGIEKLAYNEAKHAYVVLQKSATVKPFPVGKFKCSMKMKITEVDAGGDEMGTYEEESKFPET